jgi:hypothetical protein
MFVICTLKFFNTFQFWLKSENNNTHLEHDSQNIYLLQECLENNCREKKIHIMPDTGVLNIYAPTEGKIHDMNDVICEELEHVFNIFPK